MTATQKLLACGGMAAALMSLPACTHHTIDVQPIRIEPIYMTIDVNVKVDRELDQFFDFENRGTGAESQPATSTATDSPVHSQGAAQ